MFFLKKSLYAHHQLVKSAKSAVKQLLKCDFVISLITPFHLILRFFQQINLEIIGLYLVLVNCR